MVLRGTQRFQTSRSLCARAHRSSDWGPRFDRSYARSIRTPITSISAMRDIITRSVAQPRFYAVMLGSFAILAVVLAMLGLYAVLSQSVEQRRQEIGIRMALGAAADDILTMLLGQGLRLALMGAAVGLAGALATSRLVSRLLFGVAPNDALTLVATIGLIVLAAIVAIVIPAHRAARLDPMHSLRQ